jgi:RNA polymerase sigma-70 factor (ECF subfamily)
VKLQSDETDQRYLRDRFSPCVVGGQDEEVRGEAAETVEAIYREHGERMWRSLLAFSGDPHVASDAVSEAFAQALRRGDELRDPRAWIWRSAFKIAAGDLHDRRRATPLLGEALGSYEMDGIDQDLLEALRQLGDKQRAAIVLHHAAGYPVGEIASILGVSSAAVKMHLMRARRRLRDLLEDGDD